MPERYYREHDVFIENVRRFVGNELAPNVRAWEEAGRFPDDVFRMLGRNGFLGILIPERYGGSGGDYRLAGAWCEVFGELCDVGLTTAVNMHSLVISSALARHGSDAAKEKWLARATAGEAIGAYAFTEPGAGSDLANIRTRAERRGDRWILNGSKTFITNGARADFILVLAKTDSAAGYKGFTTFIVDTSLPGFSVTRTLDKLGWRSSDTAELSLQDLELEDSAVLGAVGNGWGQAANNLNWERAMLTLTSLAGARTCFRETVRYAKGRSAFGKPIFEIDAIGALFEEMHRRITTGEALARHALTLLDTGAPCRAEVSAAKRLVCDDAVWIADRAIQIHGGYGYTSEFSAEKWWRDLRLMPIGGGTSQIMANIVAKELKLI